MYVTHAIYVHLTKYSIKAYIQGKEQLPWPYKADFRPKHLSWCFIASCVALAIHINHWDRQKRVHSLGAPEKMVHTLNIYSPIIVFICIYICPFIGSVQQMFHCTHPRPSSDYKSQKEFSFSLLLINPSPPLQISDQILQAANKSTFVGSVLVSQGLARPPVWRKTKTMSSPSMRCQRERLTVTPT